MPGEGRHSVRRTGTAEFISNFWNTEVILAGCSSSQLSVWQTSQNAPPGTLLMLFCVCGCSPWLRAGAQSLICPRAPLWALGKASAIQGPAEVPPRPHEWAEQLWWGSKSQCRKAGGALETGWGLINVHSSLIDAEKGLLEWSCRAGFDNANSIHPASCCSVEAVCVAACRIMVLLWEYYVPWIEPHRAICFILTNPSK